MRRRRSLRLHKTNDVNLCFVIIKAIIILEYVAKTYELKNLVLYLVSLDQNLFSYAIRI